MVRRDGAQAVSENPQCWSPPASCPHAARPRRTEGPMRESALRQNAIIMDIERVNAIGSLLADLSARTEQLRGYL
jgi:hypothetical protein